MYFQTKNFETAVAQLKGELRSEHFVARYGLRHGRKGDGLAIAGVRDPRLVVTYLAAMEQLYRTIRGEPFCRRPPRVDKKIGKTRVYVIDPLLISDPETDPYAVGGDPSALTTLDQDLNPFIVLPTRFYEVFPQAETLSATATAVHEATHVFNFSAPPYEDLLVRKHWGWFDEATAVFMEGATLTGNCEWLRYGIDWCDRPELPVDYFPVRSTWYAAGPFARYLGVRLTPPSSAGSGRRPNGGSGPSRRSTGCCAASGRRKTPWPRRARSRANSGPGTASTVTSSRTSTARGSSRRSTPTTAAVR